MASSPQNKQVYDSIRKKWVDALPEEIVRQKLLAHMIEKLGYPRHSFAIEKKLSEVSKSPSAPNRRLDILCFETKLMEPLLLIECKGVPLHEKMVAQVVGYNAYIGAPLICLANQDQLYLEWSDREGALKTLPHYEELVHACV